MPISNTQMSVPMTTVRPDFLTAAPSSVSPLVETQATEAQNTQESPPDLFFQKVAGSSAENSFSFVEKSEFEVPTLENIYKGNFLGPEQSGKSGIQINADHPILRKLNQVPMRGGRNHSCVETVLTNLDRLGVKTFAGGTTSDPNNPRGAMVQMLKAGNWASAALPGSSERTIKSPAYGSAKAHVLTASAYMKLANEGKIPNGAIVFQTQHGWNYSGGSRGNDMGICRNGQIFNYANMGSMNVYGGGLREVVVMVPPGAMK